jgi:uncharacterized membrane protein YeaQ/YmgE (transglycosylase-associated protein family)
MARLRTFVAFIGGLIFGIIGACVLIAIVNALTGGRRSVLH